MTINTTTADTAADTIEQHAARIRVSGVLGRSGHIRRLFDFLVDCARQQRVPKEIEVAIDGFGRDAGFDATQDALVRVYVHKLRRKLEEFYTTGGRDDEERIAIPRGEYRLIIQPRREVPEPEAQSDVVIPAVLSAPLRGRLARREWLGLGMIAVLACALLVLVVGRVGSGAADTELAAVRASSVWAPLLQDDLPIQIVLGDYYIFGELTGTSDVKRLVRDFAINSRQDLEQQLQARPELAQRYEDLNLGYLPTSSAYALREVLPVLMGAHKRVSITLASELDPAAFKSSHVVYIGYLSALGMLQDIVFAGSRFSVGSSYDELIDVQSGTPYSSEAGGPIKDSVRYRDYAYFSTFKGPNGNQHVIIAGTRDTAVMQTAEVVARSRPLDELTAKAAAGRPSKRSTRSTASTA